MSCAGAPAFSISSMLCMRCCNLSFTSANNGAVAADSCRKAAGRSESDCCNTNWNASPACPSRMASDLSSKYSGKTVSRVERLHNLVRELKRKVLQFR